MGENVLNKKEEILKELIEASKVFVRWQNSTNSTILENVIERAEEVFDNKVWELKTKMGTFTIDSFIAAAGWRINLDGLQISEAPSFDDAKVIVMNYIQKRINNLRKSIEEIV